MATECKIETCNKTSYCRDWCKSHYSAWWKYDDPNLTKRHGLRSTPEYAVWASMRQRCLNPHNRQWKHYGGRGIKVSESWDSFNAFYKSMGARPSSSHSIERIDNDGNYEPGNCRWATRKEQNNNTRRNRLIDVGGTTKTLSEWIAESSINSSTVRQRFYVYGWPIEKALGLEV